MNPLFADEPTDNRQDTGTGYVLPHGNGHHIEPPKHGEHEEENAAVALIRSKIDALYASEPNVRQEEAEAEAAAPRSKHQQFMHRLSTSGKSLAEIQTAWHAYYAALPDHEKQEVWQEFYAANARRPSAYTQYVQRTAGASATHTEQAVRPESAAEQKPAGMVVVSAEPEPLAGKKPKYPADHRDVATIKRQVLKKVRTANQAQLRVKHHVQSLLFGLGVGGLVLLIFLFGFFNEVVIAPFIQPGSHASATPIILSSDGVAPTATPEVIIPKINVELPIIYGSSNNESDIENSLEDGVVHYPTTSAPGQQGNAAFFGHSSNNIFNPGKYKFAFVLLHTLEPGDIFYLTNGGKVYTYKVYDKKIVEPTEVDVLNPVAGKTATATLITCDPPGTSLHRLVVWGEQISPDPSSNTAAPATSQTAGAPSRLADNGPTLWSRLWGWLTSL